MSHFAMFIFGVLIGAGLVLCLAALAGERVAPIDDTDFL